MKFIMAVEISIIIPVFNSALFLETCVGSVINQSFKNIEIILINDGSTDSSYDICEKFASIDSRVKVIHQSNQGVSVARNTGIHTAKGDFICFVDSDDWIETDFCKQLHSTIIRENCDLVMCGWRVHMSNTVVKLVTSKEDKKYLLNDIHESLRRKGDDVENLFGNSVCGKIFKRAIIHDNNILFTEKLRIGEDAIFISQYKLLITSGIYIKHVLYNYNRLNENSTTLSYVPNYYDDVIQVKERLFEINKQIVQHTSEYKLYQHLRVAAKAICEEGKIDNGKSFYHRYKSIKGLCNVPQVRLYSNTYSLPNEKDRFYQLIRKLTYLNQPFAITIFLWIVYKFNILK